MWSTVAALGFTGGLVLEPGCGSGTFLGLAPPGARLLGVELEPVTARIAQARYPHADIRAEGFETTRLASASVDLVIGNVPFGNYRLHDPFHNPDRHSIHNHFLLKAADLVRPGGIVAVLTSRYTLDGQGRTIAARRQLAAGADLLGAVRLPSGAFADVAGTDAVIDLLVLRRRLDGEAPLPTAWEHTAPLALAEGTVAVNEYFAARPHLVLGRPRLGRGLYRDGELIVDPDDARPLGDALAEATAEIVADAGRQQRTWVAPRPAAVPVAEPQAARDDRPAVAGADEGSYLLDRAGTVYRVAGGRAEPAAVKPQRDLPELRALIGLRDAVGDVLARQHDDAAALADAQQRLHQLYDRYVGRYGPLNRFTVYQHGVDPDTGAPRLRRRYPSMGGFRTDPGVHLVLALEVFDAETQTAAKAAVFDQRVIAAAAPRTTADTAQDALAISLEERGRVDVDRIGALLGVDADQASTALGDLAFDDPADGTWQTAERYLSGNVRAKLAAARAAAARDPRWARHVAALEAVQPADLTPAEIDGRLGAPWIPAADVSAFTEQVLAARLRIEHAPLTASWTVEAARWARSGVVMTSEWGTGRADAVRILEASLNQQAVTVYDELDDGRRVVNAAETLLAREKQDALGRRFAEWLWEDPARAQRLAGVYNERFNSDVVARYDGSHLLFPGLAATWTMRPHQADAVWRIVTEGGALLGHVVGAGKTATMVAAAMELQRLGRVAKPAFVVPNHMLEQFTREFLQLYPAARVLVAAPEDASRDGRQAFVARCATGRWDAVILTHSAFGRLPVSAQARADYVGRQLDRFRAAHAELADAGGRRTVKQLEKAIKNLEEKHARLLAEQHKDDGVTFEQTGIDYLLVDEAHAFKNLPFPTRIQGVGGQGSQRAEDLFLKLDLLRRRHGRQVATFATATPIANSVAEMYVMQSYLQPDALEQRGIGPFDAWAATFGSTVTAMELAPDGGSYRMHTRFARFRNVPELTGLFAQVADVQTAETLQLPTPAIAGGGPQTVVVPASDGLRGYVADLVRRAEQVRARAVDPAEDNMLKVTGDGRRAALDLRLVGEEPDPAGGKIAAVADRTAAIYREHRDRVYRGRDGAPSPVTGALQVVFCDLGTPRPGGGWSVYQAVRDALADRGVPASAIRVVHDAASDRDKAALFADCRAGRVAVLLGSTEKMGVGTNVQDRLVALHHLDAPWRPADIEQREGRIVRQGNQNAQVQILRYVTEGSFDVYMWQTLERKAGFIGQVVSGRTATREVEEVSAAALSFAEVKALATGNPLVLEKAEVDTEVARLQRLARAHERDRRSLAGAEQSALTSAAAHTARADRIDATIAGRRDTRGDRFAMRVDEATFTSRGDAGAALRAQLLAARSDFVASGEPVAGPLGALGGYPLRVEVRRSLLATDGDNVDIDVLFDAPQPLRVTFRRGELGADRDPRQTVQRLERALHNLEADADRARRTADLAVQEAGRAAQRRALAFPDAERLAQLQVRQDQIEAQLAADLAEPDLPAAETPLAGTPAADAQGPAAPPAALPAADPPGPAPAAPPADGLSL